MTVVSLTSPARHASTLAIATEGEVVHIVSHDEAAWWIARLEVEGGVARVRVGLQSALCESVRRTGRVSVVVYRDGSIFEQACAACVLDDDRAGSFAALTLHGDREPISLAEGEGEPPRT
jgi:hypothetical protein